MISVGLDIGTYSIKVVELDSKKSGNFKLNDRIEILIDNEEDPLEATEKAIKKIAHHYQGQSVKFIFPINQELIGSLFSSFPLKDRHKILKSLPFQLSDDVPFNATNVIYEAKFLATYGNNTEVLSLIVDKKHLEETIDMARECGIEPTCISSPATSLSNLVSNWATSIPSMNKPLYLDSNYQTEEDPTGAKVIMDIGHKTTNILIVVSGCVIQVNTIFFGGSNISDFLAKTYEISMSEAQNHLNEKGFILASENNEATDDQKFFSNTIKESIKNGLTKTANKIFLSTSTQKQIVLENIFLIGGVSKLTGLVDFLSQEFNIKSQLFKDEDANKYATATGLAIEGFKTPKNPAVNFIKDEFSPKSQFFYNMWKAYGYMIKVGFFCVILLFVVGIIKGNFASSLSEKGYDNLQKIAKSPSFNIKRPSPTQVRKFIKNKLIEINSKDELTNVIKSKSALELLEQISLQIPDKKRIKLDVKKLQIKDNQVNIQGLVGNQNQKQELMMALRELSRNKRVNPTSPSFSNQDPTKIPFAYTFSTD